MARILSLTIAAVLCAVPVSSVHAFWWGHTGTQCGDTCCKQRQSPTMCDYCHQVTGVNQRWPSPYVCPDRVSAHAPFNAMISNGWRRQNLMGSHHFNHDSTKLTKAGELKVHWIMTQAPPSYRRMFIERSFEQGITDRRKETVREFSTRIANNGAVPQVSETHIVSEGRPASTVDFVISQFRQNMRVPMLPVGTQGGGGDQ